MIAIGLSPNTDKKDVLEACKTLLMPWSWKSGSAVLFIEDWFQKYLGVTKVVSTNSGRSAMWVLLQSFGIKKGEEVIVQAFTCLAVPEVVKWVGATPVFVDIDESLNIDVTKLESSITKKTKAIIVQHTFGKPANISAIKKITQKYNLVLIEDCAHSLGATYNGNKVGTLGDASFFSFGRDKGISSVFGGLAAYNNTKESEQARERVDRVKKELSTASFFWIFQQLLHPIISEIALQLYDLRIGKAILVIFQKLHLLSFPLYSEEKKGKIPHVFPKQYPNALARLLILQMNKFEKLNTHRKKISQLYTEKLAKTGIMIPQINTGDVCLRYNIQVENPKELLLKAKKHGFLLGNWYHDCIDPVGSKDVVGYKKGSCPNAEKIAEHSINLPTHYKMKEIDVEKLINVLQEK